MLLFHAESLPVERLVIAPVWIGASRRNFLAEAVLRLGAILGARLVVHLVVADGLQYYIYI